MQVGSQASVTQQRRYQKVREGSSNVQQFGATFRGSGYNLADDKSTTAAPCLIDQPLSTTFKYQSSTNKSEFIYSEAPRGVNSPVEEARPSLVRDVTAAGSSVGGDEAMPNGAADNMPAGRRSSAVAKP